MKAAGLRHFLPLCLFTLLPLGLFAQTIPVGTFMTEEAYRRAQLMGIMDPAVSFSVRPISPVQAFGVWNAYDPDSFLVEERWSDWDGIFRKGQRQGTALSVQLLPIERYMQYTSDHPYSLNDGGMIPAVGWESMTRFGGYLEFGWYFGGRKVEESKSRKVEDLYGRGGGAVLRRGIALSLQLQPEYVSAQNLPFDGFPEEHSGAIWEKYWEMHSRIDWPERFGDFSYSRMSWGQSSARLNVGPVSAGLSNENLWWGPGRRNALIMTNTAAGFKHLTFNTVRPIKTPIGSFEFQVIGGRLDSSGFYREVPDSTNPGFVHYYSKKKPDDWVYLNGMVITYQPRFLPGLHLGFTRVFQTYHKDMGSTFRDYLPVIMPLSKVSAGEEESDNAEQNQLLSVFARWVMPESHAEVYMEFGRDDHAWDLRDLFLEPFHSRAYLIGFRKILPFKDPTKGGLEFSFEHTQLQNSQTGLYRSSGPWYLHSQIRQGYMHEGQFLGAGVGPGGGMQTLEISYLISVVPGIRDVVESGIGAATGGPGLRRDDIGGGRFFGGRGSVGMRFERFVHNDDFHYAAIKDVRAHWVDWSLGAFGDVVFKNFVFHLSMDFITSLNYQHLYEPAVIIDPWWNPGVNRFNFVGGLGVTYRF